MPINYNEYPPNWKEIRERILLRADNKCEFCGIENKTLTKKGSIVVLTIAHLDHDHRNFEVKDERLRALCQSCHLSYDRPRHIFKRKYGMNVFNEPTLF
jgi:5-methylcytosine-specific restriction endonuclease McrA